MNDDGLTTVPSAFSVRETIDRLAEIATTRGLRVFARVDHAAGAAEVGLVLRPTELLLIGHPRGGTPLMQDRQTAGLDLPIKALAWEDAEGQVWVTYNEASWLAQRHRLGNASSAAVVAIEVGQQSIVLAATTPSPPEPGEH